MAGILFRRSCPYPNAQIPHTIPVAIPLITKSPRSPPFPTSLRPLSTASKMSSTAAFLETTKARRSIYALSNESTVPDARITELVTHALRHVPSAFNSQTTRIVVLLNYEHVKLWDVISDVYRVLLPADKFAHAEGRFKGFRAAHGTILFYENTTVMRSFQEKFKTYEDKFPGWSEQTSGMHQYTLWTALQAEGLGCNLQHYNPLIDVRIETEWNVPADWALKAQLVFGKPVGPPGEKTFGSVEEKLRVFGAD